MKRKGDDTIFWDASTDELKNGYIKEGETYTCVICEENYLEGRIYEKDGLFYDAEKSMKEHIKEKHESMLSYILNMSYGNTGITQAQQKVLQLIAQGKSDKEVASALGVADSTIRNHKYKLREKEKQAKVFLAMMELLSEQTLKEIKRFEGSVLQDPHNSATMLDDRYNITDKEVESIRKTYFDDKGGLKSFPAREKKKLAVLSEIVKNFVPGKQYEEKELNRILKRIYDDNAAIRRALIEYGFMDRTNDGTFYWV
jgi:Trp operon repressor